MIILSIIFIIIPFALIFNTIFNVQLWKVSFLVQKLAHLYILPILFSVFSKDKNLLNQMSKLLQISNFFPNSIAAYAGEGEGRSTVGKFKCPKRFL
jgi:hypothetical protein